MSEDCLFLNVWVPPPPAPSSRRRDAGGNSGMPVMVWVHGGGLTVGAGSDRWYDGGRLAGTAGVIVVTLNYRLGPLGFLA
eukprot:1186303-Pyramimonas_sp.AAC.2